MAHAARPPWVADVLMAAMSADEAGCTVHGNAITGYGLYTQDIGICILVGHFFFFSLGTPGKPLEPLMASRISLRGIIFRMAQIGFWM